MKKTTVICVLLAISIILTVLLMFLSYNNTTSPSVNLITIVNLTSKPMIRGCQVFPDDNWWNQDISNLPIDSRSDEYINSIGANGRLTAEFGGNEIFGIPYVVVTGSQPKVPVNFESYEESDRELYPIPENAPIEGRYPNNSSCNSSDRHIIVLDNDSCMLYELFKACKENNEWHAGSGAIFNLSSNKLRPLNFTSADAAGLPILPGLIRYEEVENGTINHALRVTVKKTQKAYILPATHFASNSSNLSYPPMGLRLRLKKDYDISSYYGQSRVILEALKKYGLIVADNGNSWQLTREDADGWDGKDLKQLRAVLGSAFEVVNTSLMEVNMSSTVIK